VSNSSLDEILFNEKQPRNWQMWMSERLILRAVLEEIRPKISIEIGTAQGGSLGMISKYSEKVYTLDISPNCKAALGESFPNTTFITGNSKETLPELLRQLDDTDGEIGFILIDGDHSYKGVLTDIRTLLEYRPRCPTYILMHDSYHPACRRAMKDAPWESCPYVHSVQLDLSVGHLHLDGAQWRKMWGGLALATLQPNKREHQLTVEEYNKTEHHIIRWFSSSFNPLLYLLRRLRAAFQ